MEQKKEILFMQSIMAKIVLLVVGVVVLSSLGNLIGTSMETKAVVGNINENYIMSMAETAANLVEEIPQDMVSSEEYANALKDIKMTGIVKAVTTSEVSTSEMI